MTQIITAKTVEEAKALAARTFGVAESEITFEVLEEPKKGFLGFKKGEAKVRATYVSIDVNADDRRTPPMPAPIVGQPAVEPVVDETPMEEETAAEAPAEESVIEVEPVVEVIVEEAPVAAEAAEEAPNAEVVVEEKSVEEASVEDAPVEAAPAAETTETASETVSEEQRVPEDEELVAGEPSEAALAKIEIAKAYITSVFHAIDVEVSFEVTAGAESAIINITSSNNGAVIGRRGETLDALQYLTFLVANRGDKEFYRIILDSADYRERRRKTLEELAERIARNVLRSGRTYPLEPMNPYERRIVHSAISGIEGVVSRSVGEEPYRKVLISPENGNGTKRRRKPRNDRNDNRGGGNHRRDRRKSDTPPERISMDSMKTSFEKDYKRPKAEDEINAGLYGKIEF